MHTWPSITSLANDLTAGKTTATELTQQALDECKTAEEYNALITINPNALDRAKHVDALIKSGELKGALAGIPFIAKDNFLTEGVKTTAASNILANFEPPYSATAIMKLEAAGAILIAKANLDSFAHGSSTENSDMGTTLNPHDKERVPGGSSGGSAAAVVLGLAPFAVGTDTGGSIRQPASFSGAVGYKPTYGLVSRYGIVAMASSTDVVGPLTSSVADAAIVLECLSGRDVKDGTAIERDQSDYSVLKNNALEGKKIGVIKQHMGDGVDDEVRQLILDTLEKARSAGAEVVDIDMPRIDMALAAYYIIMPAEVSSNLSRYDGIRYGHSSKDANSISEIYEKSRTEGFNDEVKRRIMIGTYVLSSGYYDAYYKKAQSVRTLLIEEFNQVFDEVDFLAGPVTPTTAVRIGQNIDDPLKMYLMDVMTVATNLVGNPAISIPAGKDSSGLPVGIQLMAQSRHDHDLLQAANHLESNIGYQS